MALKSLYDLPTCLPNFPSHPSAQATLPFQLFLEHGCTLSAFPLAAHMLVSSPQVPAAVTFLN